MSIEQPPTDDEPGAANPEAAPSSDSPTGSGSGNEPKPEEQNFSFATVTESGLRVVEIRLRSLVCVVGETTGALAPTLEVRSRGSLVPESTTPTGFKSMVSWSLEYPDGTPPPISISGKHELTFTVEKQIRDADRDYYAEVNGVILVFPYLRQLIDDLTVKCLGRNILIAPLDVPRFTQQRVAEKLEQLRAAEAEKLEQLRAAEAESGGSSDGTR